MAIDLNIVPEEREELPDLNKKPDEHEEDNPFEDVVDASEVGGSGPTGLHLVGVTMPFIFISCFCTGDNVGHPFDLNDPVVQQQGNLGRPHTRLRRVH